VRSVHIEPVRVRGDAHQLAQVLRNLTDNAARHATSTVRLRVTSDPAAGCAVVEVADDGPGVPAADRGRIFERFVRLDDSRQGAPPPREPATGDVRPWTAAGRRHGGGVGARVPARQRDRARPHARRGTERIGDTRNVARGTTAVLTPRRSCRTCDLLAPGAVRPASA
jgi:hypothetical protein